MVTPTEKRTNRFGEVIALEPALAKYTRRGLDMDTYWFVQYGMTTQPYQFTKGSIFHLMEPDINREIYGLPGYLSAIPSALLNESATLFRRKYYINGSHAGFIMYMTDAAQNQEDVNNLRNAMKSAKGLVTSVTCLCTRLTVKRRASNHPVIRSRGEG